MNTIQRLGERETVDRITNGTLKSYVDREIDTADTSDFNNLEVLNTPKAESVVIGEGVKDTLEVLNAPKAEEVAVNSGEKVTTVNWGKCGGTEDVVVTYKEGEPLWIPNAYFTSGINADGTMKTDSVEGVGYKASYHTSRVDYVGWAVWELPYEIGKYLYENAESYSTMAKYGQSGDYASNRPYREIAMYPNTVPNWTYSPSWMIRIRTKKDINCEGYTSDKTEAVLTPSEATAQNNLLKEGVYYVVANWQSNEGSSSYNKIHNILSFFNIDDKGEDHLFLRTWKDLSSNNPSGARQGSKYTASSPLAVPTLNNDLSNLPNLKVADVRSADVDVPMFKGCTNLEKATVGGTKGVEPLVVNWGKCGGSSDVEVTYDIGEPLWIPYAFLNEPLVTYPSTFSGDLVKSGNEVGWKAYRNNGELYYKLPQNFGKWLYENAEDCKDNVHYGLSSAVRGRTYKGIAIYPDSIGDKSWSLSNGWVISIRKKSDADVLEWTTSGELSRNVFISYFAEDNFEDNAYYLVALQQGIESFDIRDSKVQYGVLAQLAYWGINDIDSDHIYLRHYNTMTSIPSTTNQGKKYTVTSELLSYPTLDSSYFEGCDNLKEVTITNPYLRFNNAIPSTVDLYADDSKLPSDGLLEYSKNGLPPITVTMATYLQANNSGYRVKGAEEPHFPLPLGGKIFYIDPNDNGATYTFYDANGNEVSGITVSELASAMYYKKSGTSTSDKVYVYHDELYTNKRWTYYKNGAYVYNTIGSLQQTIGSGKSNTEVMMAMDGGAYVTADSNGTPTIWYQLQRTCNDKIGGYDDWFVPSKDEIDKFREADLEAWHRASGGSYLWSSSEASAQQAWTWYHGPQGWGKYDEANTSSVFFVRAF